MIPELYRRMVAVLADIGQPWELVCVNDGSRDESLSMLLSLRDQDTRVKIINFSRNFGHQIAITAGMDYAMGDAIAIIDADLQDPPELIGEMFEKWRAGYEVSTPCAPTGAASPGSNSGRPALSTGFFAALPTWKSP